MERLIGNTKQLDVISIVGMGGIGKTTMALKVYNNASIVHHFYIRVWITVSQNYVKSNLLVGILSSLYNNNDSSDEIHKMSDGKLSEELYKRLKGNKYLIVLDDIWNNQVWDDLKRCFPNDKIGSRIILTSRIKDVCLHAKPDSVPYELRFLSEEESWDLLKEKIFHREICPPELMKVGKKIAKKCQGLPLAVVVIGGLLAKTEKNKDEWKQVAESMGKQCMETLELSYNHLPNHLKPLFLYFGIFPEDYEISLFRLVWLWIAEGFVKKNGDETLEDTAFDYLIDLIGRCLIVISKRSSNGKVKSCRIHDLLRDLCLRKAEEENFMQVFETFEHLPPHRFQSCSSSDAVGNKVTANKVCRLSINSRICYRFPFGYYSNTSSILIYKTIWTSWFSRFINLQPFRLLQVLDLKDAHCEIVLNGLEHAVHLRYLGIRLLSDQLVQSISNLQNLETLIIIHYVIKSSVKVDISNMTKLRHLKIDQWGSADVVLDGSLLLADLQTMCTLWFNHEDYYDSLKSTPNLRRFKCIFSRSSIHFSSRGLEFLAKLESLTMSCKGLDSMNHCLDLPASLKKITLSNFLFDWRDFSKLANLPKLEVLKLLSSSFKGERWDTSLEESDLQFPKLKFLKFRDLNIVEWNASKDHFPSLQRLVLENCRQLKTIPYDIGDIPTLEMIELKWCNHSANKSAQQILEEQQGVGNEKLKIFIHPITRFSLS